MEIQRPHVTFVPIVLLLAFILSIPAHAQVPVQSSEVEVMSGDLAYNSYLAVPETEGPKPAVVLLHSINDLQPGYRTLSDQLAAEDFVVLALGWQTHEREPAQEVMAQLLDDAIAYLRERDDVDPEAIGLTGFCIGGYFTMYYLSTIGDFAAGVAWYGFPHRGEEGDRPIDAAVVEQLEAPMLIVHGTADEPSPVAGIYEYATVLDEAGKYFELKVYQGEPHSFLVSGELLTTFAALDAYEEMVNFFNRTLR